jgi:uracil-DNA glycosylase
MSDDAKAEIAADLRARAQYYASFAAIGVPNCRVQTSGLVAPAMSAPARSAPASRAATLPSLVEIREEIGDCRRCKLAGGRKNIVFGQGNPKAQLMFVGEAPGSDEDEQGLAFVGRAGQLLTDIIEKGLKIPRPDVYIANVIKCRPPQNRNPEPDEITSCQPFLEAQIRTIQPRVLVGLGKFAGQWLLKTAEPISRIRGRLADYGGIPVMPTWHPAYLLRNPAAKRDVWEDMKIVRSLLDRPADPA